MSYLHCIDHPLAADLMTRLRDRTTKQAKYRALCDRITFPLALEAGKVLGLEEREVETPLETTTGHRLAESIVLVPILRAGLGMLASFLQLYPRSSVGIIGLERDEETAKADTYYCKLPKLEGAQTFLLDPMLATGGSACRGLHMVRKRGAAPDTTIISIIASPEGVERVHAEFPEVRIITAAVDRGLNEHRYILPGLGDFGDRLFGT